MAASTALPRSPESLESEWKTPDRGAVGVIFLILTETALFTMFVAVYLIYIGKSLNGPYPKDVLDIPIVATICLLSSSLTIVFAEHALKKTEMGRFKLWWAATILLGLVFLTYTGIEWRHLIYHDHLTISTNLFGTTFYSLGGIARESRNRRHDVSVDRVRRHAEGISDSHPVEASVVFVVVLAFRGCGVGGRLHSGVHHRQIVYGARNSSR